MTARTGRWSRRPGRSAGTPPGRPRRRGSSPSSANKDEFDDERFLNQASNVPL